MQKDITERNGQTEDTVTFPPRRSQHHQSKRLRHMLRKDNKRPKTLIELMSHTGYTAAQLFQYLQHFHIRQSFDRGAGHYLFEIIESDLPATSPFKALGNG